jgi:hypothetical protein
MNYRVAFWVLVAACLVGFWWGFLSVKCDRDRKRGTTLHVLRGGRAAAPDSADITGQAIPQSEDLPTEI